MFQTIRARLTAISVVITTSSLIALAIIAYAVVRDYTLRSIDSHIGQLTHEHASKVSVWIQEKQRIASALKLAVAQAEYGDPDLLLQSVKQSGAFDHVFFTRSADKRHFAIPPITDASFDGTSRPWYKQAAAAGGPVVTPAYVDAGTGKLNVTLAEPVGPAGQPQAVIGVAFLLESMSREIAAIRPLDKSFAVLLDTDGSILAYRQPELALKLPTAIAPGLDAALLQRLAADGGHAQVAVDGAEQFVYAANVAGTPWTLAICVDHAEATAALAALSRTMLIAVTVCLLAAAAIIGATVHRLLRRLAVVRDALENISSSEGDLTHRLDAHGSDELSQITGAFNRFTDKIAAVLARVRSNAEAVRTATMEITAGNLDLSARTEVQASALEQTAASIEELTSAVHQNAESAQQAKRLATNAAEIAAQGNRAITSVVATMGEINEASHKIADIIGMIDGIAFQTNILALNAAVEAARAGEQGRGFAVVASEVRALAGRSAQAAKDIKTLIENSVTKAEQGAAQVADAGSKVASLLASSQRVADILAEISAASMEQSQGIEQVNQAIGQMDNVTQQNAALVEESTAATQSLESQVRQLAKVIGTFRLDHAVITKHGCP